MASIADVFLKALLDTSQLEVDAAKAGDKAGQTIGQRMAGGLKSNRNLLTGLGATGGAAFAAMTEGAIRFEDQLRTIQTVAPDIDLKKTGDEIQALAAETGKSTDDLTAGFYDLVSAGVAADDAIGVLRDSAKFATGALGSTGEAVDLVTSVMNAYGLEATDSARITDVFAKAVADGKVTASELGQSIATVAPLAAQMGVEMEEVSASAAVLTAQGFSAGEAFTNMRQAMSALLTPNVTLNKLQEETGKNFANIAREKGLAVALEEVRLATKGNNDEFGRALGSTQALSFALASTGENYDAFGNQITETLETSGLATEQYNIKSQSMAEQAARTAAQLRNLALDAGEVVAPFGQILFTVNQLAPGLRGLISPAKLLGGLFGGLLGRGVSALSGLFQDISLGKRTGLAGAVNKAGAFVGKTFSAAFAVAMKIGDAVAGALNALPGSAAVKSATDKVGTALGGKLGGFIKAGLLLAAAGIILELWNDLQKQMAEREGQFKAIGEAVGEQIATGTREQLEQSKATLEQAIADIGLMDFVIGGPGGTSPAQKLQAELDKVNAAIAALPPEVASTLEAGTPKVEAAADGMAAAIPDAVGAAVAAATEAAHDLPGQVAEGIRSDRNEIKSAVEQLREDIKNALNPAKEEAQLIGILTGKALKKGLASQDPLVVAQAEYTRTIVEDRLSELIVAGGPIGKRAMEELREGLRSKDPDIRAQAERTKQIVQQKLDSLNLYGEGKDAAQEFGQGIRDGTQSVVTAALLLSQKVANILEFGSPTKEGPFSRKGGPRGWSEIGARDWVKGWQAVDPRAAVGSLAERAAAALSAPLTAQFAAAGAMGTVGSNVPSIAGGLTVNGGIHLHGVGSDVSPQRAKDFGQQVLDEVASGFRSQTARLPTGPRS